MPGARVRWTRAAEYEIEVVGHGTARFEDGEQLFASASVIDPASITELRRAVDAYRRWLEVDDDSFEVLVFDVPEEDLRRDPEIFQPRQVVLVLSPSATYVQVMFGRDPDEKLLDEAEVAALIGPLLKRHRARAGGFEIDQQKFGTAYYVSVEVSPRGRTVADAMRLGNDLLMLLEATVGGGLGSGTVVDLLRAQRPDLLVGQVETEWLEFKQAPYGLGDPLQEVELAKDVSAMANRPGGGLLVIGLATKNRKGADTASAVRSQPLEHLRVRRYRQTLDRWIFPPLQDPRVEVVEIEPGRGVLWIHVEPQPEALWPFLVVGAVRRGKVLGNHFSLVRRRGDETFVDPAAVVHGLLVAGRVALASAPRNATSGDERGASAPPVSTGPEHPDVSTEASA